MTWADLALIDAARWLQDIVQAGDAMNKYPKLKALQERVHNIPSVAEYIASRPETDH